MTITMTETESVLASMLTENTGRHFLDSGDAYGRAWEQNQGRDFMSEPEATIDSYGCVTFNVFHWLNSRLSYNEELDNLFSEYADLPENEDEGWLYLMEEFPTWLSEREGYEDIRTDVCTVNSYNSEDALSQIIQFTLFGTSGDAVWHEYVLLQIHGGCDARGGYTRPRVFNTGDADMLEFDRVELWCDGVEPCTDEVLPGFSKPQRVIHSWYSENAGYSWYGQGDWMDSGVYGGDEVLDLEHDPDEPAACPICTAPLNVYWRPVG